MLRSIFNQRTAPNFSHYITEKAHCGSTLKNIPELKRCLIIVLDQSHRPERKKENRNEESTEREKNRHHPPTNTLCCLDAAKVQLLLDGDSQKPFICHENAPRCVFEVARPPSAFGESQAS